MAAGTTLAKVSPTGDIIGLGRKEGIYDTDVEPAGQAVQNFKLFQTTQQWSQQSFTTYSKQNGAGVFSNLQITNSFLPTGYKFGAYRFRLSFHSYDDDPTLYANIAHWAEVRNLRQMCYVVIQVDQTNYMTMRADDLVSWTDNERLAVSSPAAGEFLCLPTPGTDYAGRALDVGGQPLVFDALQNWQILGNVPQAQPNTPNFSPVISIFPTGTYDGVLVRPTG
jgi:hypothetical protein